MKAKLNKLDRQANIDNYKVTTLLFVEELISI